MIFPFDTFERTFSYSEPPFGCLERTFKTMERRIYGVPSTALRGCRQKFIPWETEKDRQRKPKERGCPAEMIGQGQPLSFVPLPKRESVSQHQSIKCVMGISRLTLCRSEINVSVAVTPGISWMREFNNSIRCSLSRAYNLINRV